MNRLLARQLRKSFGTEANIPTEIQSFVDIVERSYNHYEEDRKLLERSMLISSEELEEVNQRLLTDIEDKNEILHRIRKSLLDLSTIDSGSTAANITASDLDIKSAVDLLEKQATRIVKIESELILVNTLLNQTNDSIQVTDESGQFIFVNEECCKRLKMSKKTLLNMRVQEIEELFSSGELIWEEHLQQLKEKESHLVEGVNINSEGTKIPVEVSVKYVSLDSKGYVMAVSRDITERKKTQEQLLKTNNRLTIVNKELEKFAYVASHDLKAPLRGIGSITDWLISDHSGCMNEEGRELLHLMKNNVQRMNDLIEGLLHYSKIGKINPTLEQIDVEQLLKEIKSDFKLLKLGSLVIPEEMPIIYNDKTTIQQVFKNLINNAIKYNDRPAEEKLVEVGCKDANTHWEFYVKDNGIGIAKKYHERIFKIFQTLAEKKDKKGTGIGLAIVHKIIENNNGRIWVESEPGISTTFYFTLKKIIVESKSRHLVTNTSEAR